MNVLFIAPEVFELHKPIVKELQRQGNNVDFISDTMFPHDNGFISKNTIKKVFDHYLHNTYKTEEKHCLNCIIFTTSTMIYVCA